MQSHRIGITATLVGLGLATVPSYWGWLYAIPLLPAVLDPLAAVGFGGDGTYPAAVGAATAVLGAVVLAVDADLVDASPATGVLGGTLLGAIGSLTVAITVLSSDPEMAVVTGLAGSAPAFAAVVGVAEGRTRKRLGIVFTGTALAPMIGFQVIRWTSIGGLGGFVSLLVAVALLVYTGVLWYPFYRLGRTARISA